jgi:PAS domain S-box-containing protein
MIRPYDKSHHGGMRPPGDGGTEGDKPKAMPPPESDFEELFQSLYDAAIISDLSGRVVHANHRATDLLLFAHTELCKMTMPEIIHGADASLLTKFCNNLERERFTLVQAYCKRKDKSTFPSEIAVNKLRLRKDCLVFFIRDITRRRQMEEMLKGKG